AFTGLSGVWGDNECPVLEIVEPELLSTASMAASFASLQPEDDNPVADALAATVPLFDGGPGHVILLTGRNPDTCDQPNPQWGANEAVLAAQQAYVAGIQTHVVALGNLSDSYAQALA